MQRLIKHARTKEQKKGGERNGKTGTQNTTQEPTPGDPEKAASVEFCVPGQPPGEKKDARN